nr:hypothetical protein [Kingella kingae]
MSWGDNNSVEMFQNGEYAPIKQDTFKLSPIHGRTRATRMHDICTAWGGLNTA